MVDDKVAIRTATPADCNVIHRFVVELATYEKATDKVLATPESYRRTLFGDKPYAHVLIASVGGEDVGMALYFYNYSTWLGTAGIYIEDLIVTEKARANGVGTALLRYLARLAVETGCSRVEWAALDWNTPAIDFYVHKVKATQLNEWKSFRLTGDALANFARVA